MERNEVKAGKASFMSFCMMLILTVFAVTGFIPYSAKQDEANKVDNETIVSVEQENNQTEETERQVTTDEKENESTINETESQSNNSAEKKMMNGKKYKDQKYAYNYSFKAAANFYSAIYKANAMSMKGEISAEQFNRIMELYDEVWEVTLNDKMPDLELIEFNKVTRETFGDEFVAVITQDVIDCKEGFEDGLYYYSTDDTMDYVYSVGAMSDEERQEYLQKADDTIKNNLNHVAVNEFLDYATVFIDRFFEMEANAA